jgi:hypothetical protein
LAINICARRWGRFAPRRSGTTTPQSSSSWDEDDYAGDGGTKGSPIGRNGAVLGGARALIVVTNKDTPPRKIDAPFNHFNLLATLEAAYGMDCLGRACDVKDALIDGLLD